MASLDQTITVNVLRSPGGVPRGNFGLAMWMTHEQYSPLRAASYADINEVNSVYPDGSATRAAASIFFGQSPRPNKLIIGTKLGSVNLTPVAVNDTLYEVVINGITIGFTSDADATVPEITLGLSAAIDAEGTIGPLTTTTDNGTDFDVESSGVIPFSLTIPASSTDLLTAVHSDDASETVSTGLGLIREADDSWFVLLHQTVAKADILSLASDINALKKMHCWLSRDADDLVAATTTSTGAELKALSYEKTFGIRDSSALQNQRKDMAFVGNGFTRDVGQVTFKWKVLLGVTADAFTSTEQAGMEIKNINFYSDITMGVPMTQEGVVAVGEYIDVQRNIAFLESNVQLDLLDLFRQNDIVHIDDVGLLLIDGVLRARLADVVARRILQDDATLTVPTFEQLEAMLPPARTVTGIKIFGAPVDAVHFATVTINIEA